ncbi:MAG: hypothetical protein J6P60_02450 [Lachnospiraceae bacterium]|nr:hypothetical protein [Lachnospiraceae bacterium]
MEKDGGICFVRGEDKRKIYSITDEVTRILCPGNVYAYLTRGEKAAVLIDTGFGMGGLRF